ncbi:acyltransferase family protein [Nibribacter ruber]|uniref:Acyltransferase family protein n=1 Tax=Nibribacter ruber TaxID=2698458 RepID=A0A6P1NRG4_9BACT|nr:acyltransferase [Nibribacter ruber]QHL86267.1 acyltransferase family protein [Nibribacter ruber]
MAQQIQGLGYSTEAKMGIENGPSQPLILPSNPIPSKRILELDCTRGITAFIVVLVHFSKGTAYRDFFSIFAGGTDLFFIISGFVGFNLVRSNPKAPAYFKRRFVRLIPFFWVCVSLTFLLEFAYQITHGTSTALLMVEYLTNLSFLNYYFGLRFLDGVYWTLLIEVLFYALLGTLLSLGWGKQIERIGAAAIIYILLTTLLPLGPFDGIHKSILRYFPLLVVWPAFYAGILFNRLKYDGGNTTRWLLLLLSYSMAVFAISNSDEIHPVTTVISMTVHAVMTTVYFLFFYLSINNRIPFIVNKATLFLASISYCLYLIHNRIGNGFVRPQIKWLPEPAQFIGLTLSMVVVAFVLTHLIERPLLNKIKKGT